MHDIKNLMLKKCMVTFQNCYQNDIKLSLGYPLIKYVNSGLNIDNLCREN